MPYGVPYSKGWFRLSEITHADAPASLGLLRLTEQFPRLTRLALPATRCAPDALCAALALLTRVSTARPPLALDVSRNRLGAVGGLRLATVLRGASSLAELAAADNGFGAAATCQVLRALTRLPGLRRVLLGCNIPSEGECEGGGDGGGGSGGSGGGSGGSGGGGGGGAWGAEGTEVEAGPAEAVEAVRALLTAHGCAVHELELGGAPQHALPVGACPPLSFLPLQPHVTSPQPRVADPCTQPAALCIRPAAPRPACSPMHPRRGSAHCSRSYAGRRASRTLTSRVTAVAPTHARHSRSAS